MLVEPKVLWLKKFLLITSDAGRNIWKFLIEGHEHFGVLRFKSDTHYENTIINLKNFESNRMVFSIIIGT